MSTEEMSESTLIQSLSQKWLSPTAPVNEADVKEISDLADRLENGGHKRESMADQDWEVHMRRLVRTIKRMQQTASDRQMTNRLDSLVLRIQFLIAQIPIIHRL